MWLSRNATNPGCPGEQGESMKSHLNRKLLWPIAFVAIASSLMACSSSTKSDTAAQTTDAVTAAAETSAAAAETSAPAATGAVAAETTAVAAPTKAVELKLVTGFSGGDRAAYESIVNRFNISHPGIHVTMDVQPWDTIGQTLPAAWGTGSGPDIATPNFDPGVVFKYVADGLALPLDGLMGTAPNQLDPAVVPKFVTDAFTVNGNLYAAPANVATLQLYYNKAIFAKAGITDPPKTAEEFAVDAKKLTSGDTFGVSLADHETIQMWPLLIWMNGGDVMSSATCSALNSPETVKALTTWTNLVVKDKVSPVGQTGGESDSLFAAGKAAMQMNGPWAAPGYVKAGIDFGVAPIPAGANGQVTLASTVPMMASAKTKHPAEAQEFMAWWNSAEAQKEFAVASGFPPSRTDLADDAQVKGNAVVAQFASALPSARLYLPGVQVASQLDSDVFVPLIESITRGKDVATESASSAKAADQLAGCKG